MGLLDDEYTGRPKTEDDGAAQQLTTAWSRPLAGILEFGRATRQTLSNLADPQTWYKMANQGAQDIEDVYNQKNTADLPAWQRIPTNLGNVLGVGFQDAPIVGATL